MFQRPEGYPVVLSASHPASFPSARRPTAEEALDRINCSNGHHFRGWPLSPGAAWTFRGTQ